MFIDGVYINPVLVREPRTAEEEQRGVEFVGVSGTTLIEYPRGTAEAWCKANNIDLVVGGGSGTRIMVNYGDEALTRKIDDMWRSI